MSPSEHHLPGSNVLAALPGTVHTGICVRLWGSEPGAARCTSPLKTAVILGLCLFGTIPCIPNLFPHPVAVHRHFGLDLCVGSCLLLEVDMKAW
jgi:hypothetical protein